MNSDQTMSIINYDKSELEKVHLSSRNRPIQYNFKKIETNKTISNPSFACSLNEKETNESLTDEVKFALSNGTLQYDIKTVINSCPALTKYFSQIKTPKSKITINLPQWITKNALLEYFSYYKSNMLMNSSVMNFYSILRLADCFENYSLLSTVIKTKIIPTLAYDSAILFLQESFQKIDHNNLNFNWYELFTATKEFISINIIQYIKQDYAKLISIQKSLLEEIIEYHLLSTKKMEKELLQFLISFRQCNDIYELVSSEYLLSSSEENYAYMLSSTYSFLHCNIKDSGSFYQEIPKQYNKSLDVVFYLSYKESEDLFKINFKISNEQYSTTKPQLYSFSFICFFDDGHCDKKYTTVKVISNLKGCTNIIQISKFRQKKNRQLNIHMKLNPIHTYTLQYLANNFQEEYYAFPGIVKMSSGILKSVFHIAQAEKVSDLILVQAISLWLNDEINMNDDLNKELIKMIDWSKVPRIDMYTFLVKYTWLIDKELLSSYFFEELKIDKDLITGLKEANYGNLLIENINLKKVIEALKPKKDSLESNYKELSAIKTFNHSNKNNLFNESDEGEVKLYLQSNTIDTKESMLSIKLKENNNNKEENNNNNNKDRDDKNKGDNNINSNNDNNNRQTEPSLKLDTLDSNKELRKSYEPLRTIELELNIPTIIKNEVLSSFSPLNLLSPIKNKLTQMKQQRKGRLFRNVLNKNEACSLINNKNIQKTKETSLWTQKTTHTIKTDRSSSIRDSTVNNNNTNNNSNGNKTGTKNSIESIKKDHHYSPFVRKQQKKIITTNTKPQFTKGLYALNV